MDKHKWCQWILKQECSFVRGVNTLKDLPNCDLSEIAFIGRSNVGKSRLLNALVNRKSLARVSNTPGCTRQFNFFSIKNSFFIVDMPGYGYARTSKKSRSMWQHMIKEYLKGRPTLLRVYLLIDMRFGIKPSDKDFMDLLDKSAVSYQIVGTKIDKISENEEQKHFKEINESIKNRAAAYPNVVVTSSKKMIGIDKLQKEITEFLFDRLFVLNTSENSLI
ncbi:MAG: ribosome biogenesis GTP-binding protein YihA/YsxC [Alphaproteobacteria bacterium]